MEHVRLERAIDLLAKRLRQLRAGEPHDDTILVTHTAITIQIDEPVITPVQFDINSLPEEIVLNILDYLDVISLDNARHTCKQWERLGDIAMEKHFSKLWYLKGAQFADEKSLAYAKTTARDFDASGWTKHMQRARLWLVKNYALWAFRCSNQASSYVVSSHRPVRSWSETYTPYEDHEEMITRMYMVGETESTHEYLKQVALTELQLIPAETVHYDYFDYSDGLRVHRRNMREALEDPYQNAWRVPFIQAYGHRTLYAPVFSGVYAPLAGLVSEQKFEHNNVQALRVYDLERTEPPLDIMDSTILRTSCEDVLTISMFMAMVDDGSYYTGEISDLPVLPWEEPGIPVPAEATIEPIGVEEEPLFDNIGDE